MLTAKSDRYFTFRNMLKNPDLAIDKSMLTRGKNVFTTLISTNVLARGIDVPEVDLVINYDVPMINDKGFYNPDYANFMHRVGRTGRFGTDGLSLTLMVSEIDESISLVDWENLVDKWKTKIKKNTLAFEKFKDIHCTKIMCHT